MEKIEILNKENEIKYTNLENYLKDDEDEEEKIDINILNQKDQKNVIDIQIEKELYDSDLSRKQNISMEKSNIEELGHYNTLKKLSLLENRITWISEPEIITDG